MKPYWYAALPLLFALAPACSDDDDDQGINGPGTTQGAGGSDTTQGAGGAGGAGGLSGAGGAAGLGGAGGTSQGGGGACATPEVELEKAPAPIKMAVDQARTAPPDQTLSDDITRYDYSGDVTGNRNAAVYYVPFPQGGADFRSQLYGTDGTLLCEPDGGIVAGGDGRCTDFIMTRTNPCIVWANPRKSKLALLLDAPGGGSCKRLRHLDRRPTPAGLWQPFSAGSAGSPTVGFGALALRGGLAFCYRHEIAYVN